MVYQKEHYDVKAYSQDPYGVSKRTEYMEGILADMRLKNFDNFFRENFNLNLSSTPEEELPDSKEELELHMQLSYKQNIELAEEQAINVLLEQNKYDSIEKE